MFLNIKKYLHLCTINSLFVKMTQLMSTSTRNYANTNSSRTRPYIPYPYPTNTWFSELFVWRAAILLLLSFLIWKGYLPTDWLNNPTAPLSNAAQVVGDYESQSLFSWMSEQSQAKPAKSRKQSAPPPKNTTSGKVVNPFAGNAAICHDYIRHYAPVAQTEMRKFGIPASITLAQGLLESNAGTSGLAKNANNHFGMKCFSHRCKKGHCVNATDDTHKDFFLKFNNVWSSYRSHSLFLKDKPRYAGLFRLSPTDYKGWARGLSKAGYATDRQYAEKLIRIIEDFQLHRFDR
jgi:flagellum-specific peptidoglycan hydrolase FlgJ